MTSGLIQHLASPRRGNETFQLRRMARKILIRRERREKKISEKGKKNFLFYFGWHVGIFFPCGQKGFI